MRPRKQGYITQNELAEQAGVSRSVIRRFLKEKGLAGNAGKNQNIQEDMAKENGVFWHDMRKNPEDLPEDDKDVLVAFVNETARGREILTGNDRYLADDKLWYYGGEGKNIVAWCEVPRFVKEQG